MTTYGYTTQKKPIVTRLKRIEGQVRGVARMVEDDTYCIDILTQINAAQAALDKVALGLLMEHTKHCLTSPAIKSNGTQAKADELIAAVDRMISR